MVGERDIAQTSGSGRGGYGGRTMRRSIRFLFISLFSFLLSSSGALAQLMLRLLRLNGVGVARRRGEEGEEWRQGETGG